MIYEIVAGTSEKEVSDNVTSKMREGWRLCGPMVASSAFNEITGEVITRYAQPLIQLEAADIAKAANDPRAAMVKP